MSNKELGVYAEETFTVYTSGAETKEYCLLRGDTEHRFPTREALDAWIEGYKKEEEWDKILKFMRNPPKEKGNYKEWRAIENFVNYNES